MSSRLKNCKTSSLRVHPWQRELTLGHGQDIRLEDLFVLNVFMFDLVAVFYDHCLTLKCKYHLLTLAMNFVSRGYLDWSSSSI